MTRAETLAELVRELRARQAFLLGPQGQVLEACGPDGTPTAWMTEFAAQTRKPSVLPRGPAGTSVLCVPVARGRVLYLDREGELDIKAVDRARAAAAELAVESRPGWRPRNPTAFVLGMVAAVWFVAGLFLGGPVLPVSRPSSSPSKARAMTPVQTAESFLVSLRLKLWDSAYDLLSARARQGLSLDDFRAGVERWLADESNRFELMNRRPQLVGDQLRVGREGEPDWVWTLVREGDSWKLESVYGVQFRSPPPEPVQ